MEKAMPLPHTSKSKNINRIKYNFSWICKKREDIGKTASPEISEALSGIQGVVTY